MLKRKSKSAIRTVTWWLTGGEEECPHCGGLYPYELQFRCPDCDGPCCPHCKKQHLEARTVCPECINCEEDASNG